MSRRVRVGISTCPNDTFAFHGLLSGEVRAPGLDLEFELLDVQELNEGVLAGRFDAAKVSFHLALTLADDLVVLPSGAALGFGNGPLLLASGPGRRPGPDDRVLCPGTHTTATLLYRLFHPDGAAPGQVVFSEVMPALEAGRADFGVCIHEGRFTYAERGLSKVEDLGEVWERETGAPLPLGGIVARRAAGVDVARRLQEGLAASLELARRDPDRALPTMRAHAQEHSDAVLWQHVELYVNDWTVDLGAEGRRALEALDAAARGVGVSSAPLEVLEGGEGPRGTDAVRPTGTARLFHLVAEGAFDDRPGGPAGPWAPPSLAAEGFVHLSFADQLAGTLALHFGSARRVALLEVDAARVADALVVEPSRGGAPFPHLYRALAPDDVLRRWDLVRGPGGFELPAGLETGPAAP